MQALHMPSVTCSQGINNKAFNPPPTDSLLTIPELYDWNYTHSNQHPFFVYSDKDSSTPITLLWRDVVQAIYRVSSAVIRSLGVRKDAVPPPLVGLYSSSDTLIYIVSMIGIMRAGFPVFLISNRTSPVALQHLISISGVSHIVMNEDDAELKTKISNAIQGVQESKLGVEIFTSYIPSWTQLFVKEFSVDEIPPFEKPNLESLCIVLHSSGSTTLPKLNLWTHEMTIPAMWQPWYGQEDICGEVMSSPTIPMSGAAGVMQALFPASSGIILSGLKPTSPPTPPNPVNAWQSMISTKSTYCFILQPFLALWSEDSSKTRVLANLEGVIYGGGPLSKDVGDKLAEKGVNIFTLFGSSEGGLMNTVFPHKMGKDWEWFTFYPLCHPGFRPDAGDGTVELVLKTGPTHRPTRINTEFEGVPAFATGDLLEPHPTRPGLWRYVCRIADQETLGLGAGRKINAVAFERLIMTDPLISGAVIFSLSIGGKFGAIIEPVGTYTSDNDIMDPMVVDAFKKLVWPTIERYNKAAPEPAQLTKEKIIIASPTNPFTYGEKGMPRRKEVIASYQSEIQGLATTPRMEKL